MSSGLRAVLGLTLIVVGFFWNDIRERIPTIIPDKKPTIAIEEPSEEIKKKVSSVSGLVTDSSDRLNLAVFNKVFSERCSSYKTDAQQLNDVYTLAGKEFFGDSLRGKYDGLSRAIVSLISDNIGDETHTLTEEEKLNLASDFIALAWTYLND